VNKSELKDLFQSYGNEVDLQQHGRKLPNFRFVVLDDSELNLQKVLSNRPIMFRGEVHLNVEEKTTRATREGNVEITSCKDLEALEVG
jgi:Ras GTPase-activating protein-binding protein 1